MGRVATRRAQGGHDALDRLRRMDTAIRVTLFQEKGGETVSGSVEDASDPEAVKAMFRSMGAKAA